MKYMNSIEERNKKIIDFMKLQTEELTKSKEIALDYLVNVLKTHNPDGTLTKEFGGEYTQNESD